MVVAYFHPMRMTDAILPWSPSHGDIKGHGNHFLLNPQPSFEQDESLPRRPFERDRSVNMTEHTFSLFAS